MCCDIYSLHTPRLSVFLDYARLKGICKGVASQNILLWISSRHQIRKIRGQTVPQYILLAKAWCIRPCLHCLRELLPSLACSHGILHSLTHISGLRLRNALPHQATAAFILDNLRDVARGNFVLKGAGNCQLLANALEAVWRCGWYSKELSAVTKRHCSFWDLVNISWSLTVYGVYDWKN